MAAVEELLDKVPSELSDKELAKLDADLEKAKVAIKAQQVAVSNEQEYRKVTANLSPTQREAFAIRVGGQMGSGGASKSEKVQ